MNEGKEGYCDYMNPTRESQPGEESVVSVDKNWGHCADWCHDKASQAPSRKLMETGLNLLSMDVCNDLGGKLHFNQTSEFCTGNKKPFPKIDVYHAKGETNFQTLNEHHIAQILFLNPSSLNQTYLGPHTWDRKRITTERYHMNLDTKYKFYLGGTDSCQGDSGGPIIAFMEFKDGTKRGFTMGTGLPSRPISLCLP